MIMASSLGIGVFAGGTLTFLSNGGCYGFAMRSGGRNLASAFVGEIAAILRAVEISEIIPAFERIVLRADPLPELPNFTLPRFLVYETHVHALDRFAAPLPRKIAYFYARMSSLQGDLAVLDSDTLSNIAALHRKEFVRSALDALKETDDLGDDILRELRPFLSTTRKRPKPPY